jgi:HK97 family phage major capsid protein
MNKTLHGGLAGRFLKASAATRDHIEALSYVDAQRWDNGHIVKAAIDAMTTVNSNALVPAIGRDLMALVRPQTIVGRLEGLRRVGFQTRTIVQTGGSRGYWVNEGGIKPMSPMAFAQRERLPVRKVAAMAVVTEEQARDSDSEDMLLGDLAAAAVATLDASFIDPASQAISEERPSSVTYGQPSIVSLGVDEDAIRADIRAMVQAFKGDLSKAVFILRADTAVQIGLLLAGVNVSFNVATGSGVMFGLPALLSDGVPKTSTGAIIALVDASAVQLAGGVDAALRTSRQAAVMFSDNPKVDTPVLVSLYQTNCVAMLAEVWINWQLLHPQAAVVLTRVNYGAV